MNDRNIIFGISKRYEGLIRTISTLRADQTIVLITLLDILILIELHTKII
jgi:hypothetical protein